MNNKKPTEGTAGQQTALCEIPGCEGRAIVRGVCSPEHHRKRAMRRRAAAVGFNLDRKDKQDPESDERVDIDAVRSGAVDLADMPSVLESLCDEVEALRAEVASLHEDGAR